MSAFLRKLVLGLAFSFPVVASAQGYQISTGDTLRLRVMEWQPIEGLVREWPALTGEYVVSIDGTIAVPFVGVVPVSGRPAAEVGQEVAAALKQRFALPESPDAVIEVIAYSPVFVGGLVRTPGQYDFLPGVTLQQAISMAGGLGDEFRRSNDAARGYITGEGTLAVLEDQRLRLRIRMARLEAERGGAADITLPEQMVRTPRIDAVLQDETAIMAIRRDRLARELATLDSQKELLENEIVALGQKTTTLERQRTLAADQSDAAQSLAERGLVAQNRLFATEQTLAAIDNQLLDVSTAVLRARQSLVTTERDRLGLVDTRRVDVAEELQATENEMLEAMRRIETERQLLLSDRAFATAARPDDVTGFAVPDITVQRVAADGSMQTLPGDPGLPLEPGDVIEVRLPEPANDAALGLAPVAE